jgi:SAM-dependent methyltransferase
MHHKTNEPELTYFGIQAEWGVTKHFGGQPATDRLAALCGLAKPHSRPRKALVVGCGTGASAVRLAKVFGCQVTGVDLSPRMVGWAQQRAGRKKVETLTEFRVADVQRLPFDDAVFDAVLSESVTAFAPDTARALAEYARVTRPGGYVGLNEGTWLHGAPPAELEAFVQRTMDGVNFRSSESWQDLLVSVGLQISACEVGRMDSVTQRRDEMTGMDLHDWGHHLRAYGRVLQLYLTNARFRKYMRSMTPSRRVMAELFQHMGFGLYVGRKEQADQREKPGHSKAGRR